MKKTLLLGLAFTFLPCLLWAVQTPIYPVLNDTGAAGSVDVWGVNGSASIALNGTATTPVPPEGFNSMQSVANFVPGTWAVVVPNAGTVDLSAYASTGEMRFWAWCTNDDFDTVVQHQDTSSDGCSWAGALSGAGLLTQWVPLICPASFFATGEGNVPKAVNDLVSSFQVDMNQQGATCYIDNVRYVNPPSPGAAIFTVTVKDIATQTPESGFSWPSGVLPSGWATSNQYIELQVDDPTDLTWGVQIYTNNTAANANPKYAGSAATNPAGLVNQASPSSVIPLAWSIKSGIQLPANTSPTAAEPNNSSDPNSFQWLYMKDAVTPNIPTQNTTAFTPGELPVTVWNNQGIHYGQSNTNIGANPTPNSIFLEANFGAAMTQQTYKTNSIIVEFFHE